MRSQQYLPNAQSKKDGMFGQVQNLLGTTILTHKNTILYHTAESGLSPNWFGRNRFMCDNSLGQESVLR
ncbi:hypothetical protein HanPSC8_Chr01g0036841 [Helianthus annuus]|nr:hypothetical protein HanPSC8_Chr01g0036841 [Helianthus annuus]